MQSARPVVEHRRAPRAHGTLVFRYHRAPGGAADVAAWMAGGPARGPERVPDPTMNFSPSGIAFDDIAICADGDVLLFELGIPGEPGRWRGGARVVRISPVPIDERDEFVAATHRVAIALESFPDEGVTALAAYTERTRRANGQSA
ncbi:MAG: hypothetical protein Q8P18_20560 [Pseudomonadota bacterium]|nr:hypothetical protein [Pseudomonadota bacterium]